MGLKVGDIVWTTAINEKVWLPVRVEILDTFMDNFIKVRYVGWEIILDPEEIFKTQEEAARQAMIKTLKGE